PDLEDAEERPPRSARPKDGQRLLAVGQAGSAGAPKSLADGAAGFVRISRGCQEVKPGAFRLGLMHPRRAREPPRVPRSRGQATPDIALARRPRRLRSAESPSQPG